MATEDKIKVVYKSDRSICEAVYFGESKRSLKSQSLNLRSFKNCDCENNETAKIATLTGPKENS